METRDNNTSEQTITDHANVIVTYLNAVVGKLNASKKANEPERHIGYAFRADTNIGRLFFEGMADLDSTPIDNSLSSAAEKFGKKVNKIEPIILPDQTKKIIDYFFTALEKTPDWQKFWTKEIAKINQDPTVTNKAYEIEKIKNQIASALTFKIQALWGNTHSDALLKHTVKFKYFTKIINALGEGEDGYKKLSELLSFLETASPQDLKTKHIDKQKVVESILEYLYKNDVHHILKSGNPSQEMIELVEKCAEIYKKPLIAPNYYEVIKAV